jgi:hypothetical protein
MTRRALDQSSRYADLSLDKEQLIKNGKYVLVIYIMKPRAGYDNLATAAHFVAEFSSGTNVSVCTTDDFTKTVDALVYYIDPENVIVGTTVDFTKWHAADDAHRLWRHERGALAGFLRELGPLQCHLDKLGYTGESSVQAATYDLKEESGSSSLRRRRCTTESKCHDTSCLGPVQPLRGPVLG